MTQVRDLQDQRPRGHELFQSSGETRNKTGQSQGGEPEKVWWERFLVCVAKRERGFWSRRNWLMLGNLRKAACLEWGESSLASQKERKPGPEGEALLQWRTVNERRPDAGEEPRASARGSWTVGTAQQWELTGLTNQRLWKRLWSWPRGEPGESSASHQSLWKEVNLAPCSGATAQHLLVL